MWQSRKTITTLANRRTATRGSRSAPQAIGVVPECVARAQPWPQLTFVKVTDIPPSDVAVAWPAGQVPAPVSEFIAIVREFATLP